MRTRIDATFTICFLGLGALFSHAGCAAQQSQAVDPQMSTDSLMYCAQMRIGVQRSLTGVGPEYHVFQAQTLSLVRRLIAESAFVESNQPEEAVVREKAWQEVEAALRMPKEFANVGQKRLRERLDQCDQVLQVTKAGTRFPSFGRRSTAAGRFTQAPPESYAATLELTFRPFVVFTLKTDLNPVCIVRVKAFADRRIQSATLITASDVPEWDKAVLSAVERVGVLPVDSNGLAPHEVEITFRLRSADM